jgi:peptide/nickel transport system substrate-binding protein
MNRATPSFRFLITAITLAFCGSCSGGSSPSHITTLTFAGPGAEPDTLNPLITQESDEADFATLYMPVLLQYDDRGRVVPEIALAAPTRENGGISSDGLRITYHLRRGVVWQDGVPLTARDVLFSYRAVMNPANNVGIRTGYDQIASAGAKDPWTVVLRMKRPYSPIVAQFGNYPAYPILPAHVLAKDRDINNVPFNALPIGAGPFKVVDWARGDHITLAANPRYWRGKPHIDRLIFRFIPVATTALAQLQTGELDAWFNADPNTYPALRRTSVHLIMNPMNDVHLLLLNLRDPILKDVRARRAIQAALNREKFVQTIVHGLGIAVDGDQPTFSWAYTAPKNAIHYDPARAAALLDSAGWKVGKDGIRYRNGVPLSLQLTGTVDVTAWQQVGTIVQDELRRVGIVASLKTFAPGLFFGPASTGGILLSGKYQLAYDARLLGNDPNDEAYYGCSEFPPTGANDVFWCNAKANAAMNDALISYDQARRKRDYAIEQEEMARDVPIIPLWEVRRFDAFRVPVTGFAPSPGGSTFWNAWAWRR